MLRIGIALVAGWLTVSTMFGQEKNSAPTRKPAAAEAKSPSDDRPSKANSASDKGKDKGKAEQSSEKELKRAPAKESDSSESSAAPTRQDMLVASLAVFVLAIFVGFEVITKVPPTLHTPLMSGSNAISGITIVGALIVAGHGTGIAPFLGFIAVVLATVNAVGGFLVTHRMLAMFKKR